MTDVTESDEQPMIELPNVYFNGFQMSLSNADVSGVLLLNNQPTMGLSMSYTTAKTLAEALNEIITTLEKVTDKEIMTTKKVARGLERLAKETLDGQPN